MGCIFTRELDSHAPFPGFKGGSRRASRTATARHPYLVGTSALPRGWVRQHLVKMVGTPPPAGVPSFRRRRRRFWMQRWLAPRKDSLLLQSLADEFVKPRQPVAST